MHPAAKQQVLAVNQGVVLTQQLVCVLNWCHLHARRLQVLNARYLGDLAMELQRVCDFVTCEQGDG